MEGKLGGVYSSGPHKTRYISQPENQLLKETGETDSGLLQHSLLMLARPAKPVLSSLYHENLATWKCLPHPASSWSPSLEVTAPTDLSLLSLLSHCIQDVIIVSYPTLYASSLQVWGRGRHTLLPQRTRGPSLYIPDSNAHLIKQGLCSPLLGAPRISGNPRESSGGSMQGLQSLSSAALLVTLCFPARMQVFLVLVTFCWRVPEQHSLDATALLKQ